MIAPIFMTAALHAQWTDPAPLRPWPAPLYFDLGQPESQYAAKVGSERSAAGTNPLVFIGTTPCRIMDTRAASGFSSRFGPPSILGGVTPGRTVPIQSTCGIPNTAQAYSLNVTVIPLGPLGFLTLYPTGQSRPNASTLNDLQGVIIANAAVVPAGTNGSIDIYVSNTTDVVMDINGYYAPATGVALAAGSAAGPSLSFATDPSTGLFSSAVGTLSVTTGGVNRLTVRSDGDVDLPLTASIRKSSIKFLHTPGSGGNTGAGLATLGNNTTGTYNTAVGYSALGLNSTANNNTAVGTYAMTQNSTGQNNTALGAQALAVNTTSGDNTAIGSSALANNTASGNTAVGSLALFSNNTGSGNTAVGVGALQQNAAVAPTDSSGNTAVGNGALGSNTTGGENTAIGNLALSSTTFANSSTAVGSGALKNAVGPGGSTAVGRNSLVAVTTGYGNTAVGQDALYTLTSGTYNTAIGVGAGSALTGGDSNNVMIGNDGVAGDHDTVRIGNLTPGPGIHPITFIGGIWATPITGGFPVVINANGQLGNAASSSRRYKQEIDDMGQASTGLFRLRPVTFRYRQLAPDGSMPLDYGLIAEEVAEIYPDLVGRAPDGHIEAVRYDKLAPMLLNEIQKQQVEIERLKAALNEAHIQNREQQLGNKALETRLETIEALLSQAPEAKPRR
jgi:hypothetical protein